VDVECLFHNTPPARYTRVSSISVVISLVVASWPISRAWPIVPFPAQLQHLRGLL
jgi:hypothetical protein